VNGKWCYLYRAVNKEEKKIDFLLTQRRKKRAAHRFLSKAIAQNAIPDLINIDKRGSNKEAIRVYNRRNYTKIKYRQCKYLNNIIEQDHRFIKWRLSNMPGFKSFKSACVTLSGIETVRMIKKNQLKDQTTFLSLYFSTTIHLTQSCNKSAFSRQPGYTDH
jgi:putative transposase